MIDFKVKNLYSWLNKKSEHESKNVASDLIDRLHSQYTAVLLFLFTSVLGAKCYFGNPIDCIVPKEYSSEWAKYITNYCFIRGTYNFYGEHYDEQNSQENFIGYYQWVPIFLLFQTVCFALPSLLWLFLQNCFYIDVQTVVNQSSEIASTPLDKREEKVDKVSQYIFYYFFYRNFTKKGILSRFWRLPYIFSLSYLFVKIMFLVNVVVQLLFVCYLINADPMWGVKELKKAMIPEIYDQKLEEIGNQTHRLSTIFNTAKSYYFPTVVRCRVQTTQWGLTAVDNSLQCLLTINYINEIVFLILYIWYSLLAVITVANILNYLIGWMSKTMRNNLVKSVLKAQSADTLSQQRILPAARKFVDDFLGLDGVLLLHFVHSASNATSHQDVAAHIWKKYCGKKGITFSTRPSVDASEPSDTLASGDTDNV